MLVSSSDLTKMVFNSLGDKEGDREDTERRLYNEISQLAGSSLIREALHKLCGKISILESKRIVLITAGMSSDKVLMETDAPKEAIEEWCKKCNEEMENGENTFLDSLQEKYYVRLLYDSEVEELKCDESYDLFNYYNE